MAEHTIFPSLIPDPDPAEQLADGICPWCEDEASFDNVRAHAAQAHAEEYEDHKEAAE